MSERAGPDGPDDGGPRGELRRSLGVRDLVVYGLLFIAPMAPVGVFGVLDAKSRGAVAAVYLVATAAMGFTAVSYAQMVRAVPRTGSVYAYARAGLGEGAGFLAGWMALLDYLLIPAVAYLFSGIALHSLVPDVPRWVWTALAVLVTTALNLAGVRTAAVVGFAVLVAELAVLAVFVVAASVVLVRDGAQRGWATPFTAVGGFSASAVLSAVSVAVLSYLGFDAIATFVEEAVGASAAVARAVLWCLVVSGLLFVAQTWLAALLEPLSPEQLAADPAAQGSAFYDTVEGSVGHWLQVLVAASKAVGAAFAALAGQAAAGRLLFAMGRDGRLPRFLGAVDPGSAVPRRALLVSAGITLVAAVWAADRDDGLDRLTSVVDIGALTAFALLHASVVGWYLVRHGSRDWARHLVVPVLGVLVIGAVVAEAAGSAQVVGLVWLAVGLLVVAARSGSAVRGRR
ncbi:APC family permease [Kitasatospora purpeofusca]|uniref:APC family permease n=1 Tax=Kitasatospora purpeofusca TaxID=67352 RepID=UPI00224EAD46|nr:APC family permease [Kitasatospora purpeofusca]MCX4754667.1 APC family permease [Kitasatospora purpeofusca]WSR34072.1 APC family permease [Kitasatospora purpeofusca]WSR42298.1 APC family permease [Kitasatospora purpeofusca]